MCSTCGLQRTSPRPTPESIGFYYPEDYGPYKDLPFKPLKSKGIKGIIFNFLGLESRQLPNIAPGNMLELGCSSGSYMEYARSIGWNVDGIEFSEKAAQIAISKGFNVQVGTVEDSIPPHKPYDIIVAWMVMEHLHEPKSVLLEIKNWIKPSGYFIFLVPDADSISRKLFKDLSFDTQLPTHLFHYTPESINLLLQNTGWVVEKITYQRNANTFLKSIEIWANKNRYSKTLNCIKWFNSSAKTSFFRLSLAVLFGVTRQSGRIEVWARLA
jgi:SAM-dependent methyltransferase